MIDALSLVIETLIQERERGCLRDFHPRSLQNVEFCIIWDYELKSAFPISSSIVPANFDTFLEV